MRAAIYDETGTVVKKLSRYLGHATNNVAEYEGLLMGLEAVFQLGRRRKHVQTDSQLLVRQLKGSIESEAKSSSGFLNGL